MDKIRTKDEVIVLTGKDKGKRGVVTQRVDANHLVVDGINVAKKAVKPNPMTGATGGIVDKLMPIHIPTSRCSMQRPARQTVWVSRRWMVRKSASINPLAKP